MAKEKKAEIIPTALKRWQYCQEIGAPIRKDAEEDLRFINGDQWDEKAKKDRDNAGRPCLTINKLPATINRQVNDIRQNRPQIKTRPVDSAADVKTAEVINGIIRHIVYGSNGDIATDTAVDFAVSSGIGFMRVRTDYVDDDGKTDDQEIIIERIDDPFTVYVPYGLCHEYDMSDMPFAFITKDMTKEDFEDEYPNATATMGWETSGADLTPGWFGIDMIRVAEYYTVEKKYSTVYRFPDGSTDTVKPEDMTDVKSREVCTKSVKWRKITALEVLEETDVLGQWIPIVPITGKEINIKGKKSYVSLTRWARDPQRMINYWRTCQTENIALAPRASVMGYAGQFEGYEDQWTDANTKNIPFLQFNAVMLPNGQVAPPPSRLMPPPLSEAIANMTGGAADDYKATTGFYDSAIGNQSQETSGVAIRARAGQTELTNFHFIDNTRRSLNHVCRIVVDWIPYYYNTDRVIHIVGEDKKEQVVTVSSSYHDPEKKIYNLKAGRYDVVCDTGPSYATQRQETAQNLLDFVKMFPPAGQVAADLIVESLDVQNATVIADRLRKMMPPGIVEQSEEDKKKGPQPAELMADLQSAMKQMQFVEDENKQLHQLLIDASQAADDKRAALDNDLEKAKLASQTQITIEAIKLKQAQMPEIIKGITQTLDEIQARLNRAGTEQEGAAAATTPSVSASSAPAAAPAPQPTDQPPPAPPAAPAGAPTSGEPPMGPMEAPIENQGAGQ